MVDARTGKRAGGEEEKGNSDERVTNLRHC
jgi:hypothetical protein